MAAMNAAEITGVNKLTEYETFEWLRELLLGQYITECSLNKNRIKLDSGVIIDLCNDSDDEWPVLSFGTFEEVKLNEIITEVSDIGYEKYYGGCDADVTFKHNDTIICKIIGSADSGEDRCIFSSVYFKVYIPKDQEYIVDFVDSCH